MYHNNIRYSEWKIEVIDLCFVSKYSKQKIKIENTKR